jgi:hypothetical protein
VALRAFSAKYKDAEGVFVEDGNELATVNVMIAATTIKNFIRFSLNLCFF